ncbi:CobW family GTP-binding protein [Brevibacterium linens]|uniref:Cobalamin synthesis protein P47K n=1 Tax=Brevibacterium linens TaxID=1703 RepID=A0A0B8ZY47_BRELN|nr:CobW family GTP-binding protein [Brevibacterium linens]KHS51362.1 cobalamin synthesis protein P47K [Brevibacterium linens]
MSGPKRRPAIPVILLTGYLGAGKTSLLNHLLRHPDARIGVIVNDFGDLNIDAGLVVGQVDEPLSISGGCVCCLTDDSELEDALVAMTNPKLRLDAIIVEASGFAEPLTLARMITRMGHHRFHLGGVIDVVDATMYFDTVDTSSLPPLRFAATTLVLVNKLDQVPAADRDATVEAVRARVHERNPRVIVIGTHHARLDPTLIFDPGEGERDLRRGGSDAGEDPIQPELPIRELLRQAYAEAAGELSDEKAAEESALHRHAQSVTVTGNGPADPDAVMDFVEDLPAGVYRVKGAVLVPVGSGQRSFIVQAVGPNVYVSEAARPAAKVPTSNAEDGDLQDADSVLVVLGEGFDTEAAEATLTAALNVDAEATASGTGRRDDRSERLLHHVRLHD